MTQGISPSSGGGGLFSSRPRSPLPFTSLRPRRHTDSEGSNLDAGHSGPEANLSDTPGRKVILTRSASNLLDFPRAKSSHARSASNLLDGYRSVHGDLYGDPVGHYLLGYDRRSELSELIDFLRNQAPPSDNFMSIPDDEERGRWAKLKNLGSIGSIGSITRRSRSVRQIQLPDSAVSGVTTGGHRHIAISIPLEASPLGEAPRTQYPVFSTPGGPTNGAFRFTNEKGVVTVLRTVSEDRESRPPSSRRSSSQYPYFQRPGAPITRSRSSSSGSFARGGNQVKHYDYYGIFPKSWDRPLPLQLGGSKLPRTPTTDWSTGSAAGPAHRSSPQGPFPARMSSMPYRPAQQPPSIDGVIAQRTVTRTAAAPSSRDGTIRQSIAETVESEGDEPLLGREEPVQPAKAPSNVIPVADLAKQDPAVSGATVITDSPFQSTGDQTQMPRSKQSRRDKVRDKKRRDIEALRAAKQQDGLLRRDQEGTPRASSDVSVRNVKLGESEAPRHTFSPILVITNIEPSPPTPTESEFDSPIKSALDEQPGVERLEEVEEDREEEENEDEVDEQHPGKRHSSPALGSTSRSRNSVDAASELASSLAVPNLERSRTSEVSVLPANHSANPTPPMSNCGSPRPEHTSLDRTSLSRRREWNATRDQSKKVAEARAAMQAKAQELARAQEVTADDEMLDRANAEQRDKDFLKLYEAYREHRLRDMERRVRRLERRGDVWLRAIVPVLEDLNRTMTSHGEHRAHRGQGGDLDFLSDSASEDDDADHAAAGSSDQRRGRARRRKTESGPVLNRGSVSHSGFRDLPEKQHANEAEARSSSRGGSLRDSDVSGLDTIEPLMRELAGAATLRLTKSRAAGVSGGEAFFHAI